MLILKIILISLFVSTVTFVVLIIFLGKFLIKTDQEKLYEENN